MATYKVIQDIEAEDKLVGPLSLRQFIYAMIAVLIGFIAFKFATINIFLVIPFVPFATLFAVLAVPFGHEQSNEIWLLARVRFLLKPHKRIWNQTGMVNLVTITAPKKQIKNLTKNLTQDEVSSRLHALANTIDSRGWAIKNVNITGATTTVPVIDNTERLVDPMALPQEVPTVDITAADDILDAKNNPNAQLLDQMITSADQKHHQEIVEKINSPEETGIDQKDVKSADYWFLSGDKAAEPEPIPEGYEQFDKGATIMPGADPTQFSATETKADESILEEIKHNKVSSNISNSHLHTILPLSEQTKLKKQAETALQTPTDPAIINQALSNSNNWSVATAAHEAQKAKNKQSPDDEIIVSLH